MYPAPFRYHRAASFKDAVSALGTLGAEARLLAGGQTLIPMMKLRLLRPTDLVDIGRIAEGREIIEEASCVRIGALVNHAALAASPFAREHRAFADCGSGIADVQVRNLGTLGGSLAEADPSSCWPVLMVALDARVRCLGPGGERLQPVRSLLKDAYTPDLAAGEVITEIEVARTALKGDGVFVAFKRAAPAYPSASCALQLVVEGDEVRSARVALGCVALKPLALDGAAALLEGHALTAERIDAVAELAAGASEPVADNKGSEAYKRSLVRGLVRRAFAIVQARRAGQAHEPTHAYYG